MVIDPYVTLKDDLMAIAQAASLHSVLFTTSLQEPVPLVLPSAAHMLENGWLLHYLRLMSERGQLECIVIDECHVVLTSQGIEQVG